MQKLLILFTFFLGAEAYSQSQLSLRGERGTIYIPAIKNWFVKKDLFGLPFIYFSERANNQRSNMSFTHTGLNLKFDEKKMKDSQQQYLSGKEKWAAKRNIKIVGVYPYHIFNNDKGHKVHHIGVKYISKKKLYSENSFYIECKGAMVHAKSLNLVKNFKHELKFKSIVKELSCDAAP